MTAGGLVLVIGALAVGVALPALLLRRSESRRVRLCAALALAAVWYAAFDWPAAVRVEEPVEVQVVATGEGRGAYVEELRRSVGQNGDVNVHAARGADLRAALAAGVVRAGDDADVVLVWDGTFDAAVRARAPAGLAARAFSVAEPPPIDPADVAVRAVSALERGRPAALELELARRAAESLPEDVVARVRVEAPDATVAVERSFDRATLAAGVAELRWVPDQAGRHAISLEVRAAGSTIRADGSIDVAPEPSGVLVVGPGAGVVAAALEAQGVAVRAAAEFAGDVDEAGVVVALGPLDPAAQERLDALCDAGAGLVLVGGDGGGALPLAGEPLAGACPLVRLPEPVEEDAAGGGGPGEGPGGAEGAGDPDPGPAGDPAAAETPPTEPPAEPEPEKPAPTGDTSAAQGTDVEPAPVERRTIALVLVVDRSGSMADAVRGTTSKMDFAKRSAYETARQLEEGDELGVVAFGSRFYEVLRLGPIPDERTLRSAIERLRASDSATLVADAVERAGQWLAESRAPVRHAVVITDGDNLDPGDLARAQAAARHMATGGITVSLIQIATSRFGLASDVAKIASLGNGQFVRETDGSAIPRLVFAEVRRALGAAGRQTFGEETGGPGGVGEPVADAVRAEETGPPDRPPTEPVEPPPTEPPERVEDEPSADVETPPAPEPVSLRVVQLEESPLLAPVPDDGFPDLAGVSPVVATPRALVLLATADGTPVLAFGHRGLGRVAAWAADLSGPWSVAWRDDPAFPARLATWVQAVRPAAAAPTDADRLAAARVLEPPAPTRAEWELMERIAGAAPGPVDALEAPAPRIVERQEGHAADLALFALPTLLLLAFVEWRTRLG